MPPLPRADLDLIFSRTQALWEEMRGQRIFVTGGTGFFGCWLTESFCHLNAQLDLGAQMVVLTRDPAAFDRKMPHLAGRQDLILQEGDVRDFPFPAGTFSHIIHGATTSGQAVSPSVMIETIGLGTRRVLDFASTCGARKLLYVSSGAVYGRQPVGLGRIPETYAGAPDPTQPASAYGEGKRLAELLCCLAQDPSGLEVKIARCFTFVGPHLPLDVHFAIGNFIRDALAGSPIRVKGDGSPLRSYLYAADLALWLWTILFKGQPGRPYNVGSDQPVSIAGLARTVVEALSSPTEIHIAHTAPTGPPPRYVPDIGRARTELGLDVNIPLAAAIRATAEWYGRPE